MDFDLHFGSMLVSFSMVFALLFRASILHGFVINFAWNFMYCSKYFCWYAWSYIQLAKPSKTLCFTLLSHALHFRKHIFFFVFFFYSRHVSLQFVASFVAYDLHQCWRHFDILLASELICFDTECLTISWCVCWCLLAPKVIHLGSLCALKIIKNYPPPRLRDGVPRARIQWSSDHAGEAGGGPFYDV